MNVVHLAATVLTTTIVLRYAKTISLKPVNSAMVIAKRVARIIILVPMIPPQETLPLVIFNVSILLFYPVRMRMGAAPVDVILS